jgi:hypothetical protein
MLGRLVILLVGAARVFSTCVQYLPARASYGGRADDRRFGWRLVKQFQCDTRFGEMKSPLISSTAAGPCPGSTARSAPRAALSCASPS